MDCDRAGPGQLLLPPIRGRGGCGASVRQAADRRQEERGGQGGRGCRLQQQAVQVWQGRSPRQPLVRRSTGSCPSPCSKGQYGTLAEAHKAWQNLAIRISIWALLILTVISRVLPALRPTLIQIQTSAVPYSLALQRMLVEQDRAAYVLVGLGLIVALSIRVILGFFGV